MVWEGGAGTQGSMQEAFRRQKEADKNVSMS